MNLMKSIKTEIILLSGIHSLYIAEVRLICEIVTVIKLRHKAAAGSQWELMT